MQESAGLRLLTFLFSGMGRCQSGASFVVVEAAPQRLAPTVAAAPQPCVRRDGSATALAK